MYSSSSYNECECIAANWIFSWEWNARESMLFDIIIRKTVVFFHSIRVNWEEQVAASESHMRNTAWTNNETGTINDTIAILNVTNQPLAAAFVNATDSSAGIDEDSTRVWYMTTYAVIMAVATIFYLYRSFAFFNLCLRVSINLHDLLFRGITRAKMLFYNTNPSGRILNRFARDINNVDSLLPMVLIDCIDVSNEWELWILYISFGAIACICEAFAPLSMRSQL